MGGQTSVLIVDDQGGILKLIGRIYHDEGFKVHVATDGTRGLEKALELKPDLVILDVMMPDGYEGFDVARTIREEMGLRDLPIVLLTNLHARKKVAYKFAPDETYLPVDVFLDKPVPPDDLVATVKELLGDSSVVPETPL